MNTNSKCERWMEEAGTVKLKSTSRWRTSMTTCHSSHPTPTQSQSLRTLRRARLLQNCWQTILILVRNLFLIILNHLAPFTENQMMKMTCYSRFFYSILFLFVQSCKSAMEQLKYGATLLLFIQLSLFEINDNFNFPDTGCRSESITGT